jgi:hypothetical protein
VTNREIKLALEEFIAEKTLSNRRARTLENQKNRVAAFIKNHPGKLVSEITSTDVSAHSFR